MPETVYLEPRTVGEAVQALSGNGGAGIVAGGTDLVVGARAGRLSLPDVIVAIHRIDELRSVEEQGDGSIRIGALVSHSYLEHDGFVRERLSALADSSALVGAVSTRHVGTIGGNIVNASPAMESGSPLLCFEASVEVAGPNGSRVIPYSEFVLGPRRTALGSGEILTHVIIPKRPEGKVGSAYIRLQYRASMEIAVVGAAAVVALDGDKLSAVRVAITAAAPTCLRVPEAEQLLTGQEPTSELIKSAAARAGAVASPIDDVRAPADYRRAMLPVTVSRALELALERARGGNR